MKRYGSVARLEKGQVEQYRTLHAAVWPDVLAMIKECNIRNYSIYLHRLPDGNHYLFSYFEYIGSDFESDFARMAADPVTRKWWKECAACKVPFEEPAGEYWAAM
ncbi:MAG TPA: L-rhamnose mutarotase, partial [Tichowtungia sp.]|nr:L-rhamnose mutarotase [Tichowtungia sp.]